MKAFQYKGEVIRKSGAYVGVPISTYHSGLLCEGISISSTGLRQVRRSPAHFWAPHPLNPNRIEIDDKENRDLIFGSAAHCTAFEPELFNAQFMVLPPDAPRRPSDRQRKAVKKSQSTVEAIEFWDAANACGKELLTSLDMEDIKAMADALGANPLARRLFSGGVPEMTFAVKVGKQEDRTWAKIDESQDGIWLLARPDYTPLAETRRLLDYKTAACAEPEKWSKKAFELGYDIQAELAMWVFEMATGEKRPGMAHIVQEKEPPFVIQHGDWDPQDLSDAKGEIFTALDRLDHALKTGEWMPYTGHAFNITKPRYLRKQEIAA
jgi:exodeoxyribonuclease VIII